MKLSRLTGRSSVTRVLFAAACVALTAGVAGAQPRPQPRIVQSPHDSILVSILTMGPGEEVFERFGHQSIRMHDLSTGVDIAYNWGMFDFAQPHFLSRFLSGDTKYWMEGIPAESVLAYYKRNSRAVWEQRLTLTTAEKDSLWRFLKWNAKEENKYYRYDYYRDNCATKVRDVLDMILGGSIQRAVATHEHGVTYRSETLRLARAYPLINFGMDFVLGRPADATLSAWEEMFIPMRLQELIRRIRVRHSDGSKSRLVRSERQLVADDTFKDSDTPPGYFTPAFKVSFLIVGILLGLCMLPVASMPVRWAIGILGVSWNLLAGSVGLLLLGAELFTRHAAYMGKNVNVLLATPASLALVVLIPLAMHASASPRIVRAARSLSVFAAVSSVTAVLLRLAPHIAQQNRPLLVLAVPVQAALVVALWRVTSAQRGETV